MIQLIREHSTHIRTPDGQRYLARTYGESEPDGTWIGWLEFSPVDTPGPVLRTGSCSGLFDACLPDLVQDCDVDARNDQLRRGHTRDSMCDGAGSIARTFVQARRFWRVDSVACEAVLQTLGRCSIALLDGRADQGATLLRRQAGPRRD